MALRWYYSPLIGSDIEITDRINWPDIDIGMMANGDGWSGDLIIDDPDGNFVPMAYRRIHANEDSAPAGSQVVGNWFISPRIRVSRQGSKQVGVSRTYVVSMTDENSLLERRKFVGTDANRASETDIERIRWMLASTELNTLSPDETYIDTAGPVTLDAADLHNESPASIMASIRGRTGKHYWVKYEEAAAVGGAIVSSSVAAATVITTTTAHGLFTGMTVVIAGHSGSTPSLNGSHVITVTGANTYTIPVTVTVGGTGGTTSTVGRYVLWYANMNTSSLYPSTISLSNVVTETLANPLVWELGKATTELERDIGRLASGMLGPWKQKVEYVQNPIVTTKYAAVDVVAGDLYNVTTEASAVAQITRQLRELAIPDDEVTTTLTVQGEDINLVRHGMIVPVHVSHFPNYTDDSDSSVPGYLQPGWADGYVDCRVMERSIRRVGSRGASETFEMPVRLSPMRSVSCSLSTVDDPYSAMIFFTPYDAGGVDYSIAAPSTSPSVMFVTGMAAESGTSIWHTLHMASPWTLIDSVNVDPLGTGAHQLSGTGYLVTPAGTPPDLNLNWDKPVEASTAIVSCTIITNETAPVLGQHGGILDGGGSDISVTLPNAITAGNLLVASIMTSNVVGAGVPVGFTEVVYIDNIDSAGGPNDCSLGIWIKCADGTEGNSIVFPGNDGQGRQCYVSEWVVS